MEIEATTRKWGNSIAVIIPAKIAERERIRENEQVVVRVEKKRPVRVKDVFGILRGWNRPTQEIKDELRAGWMSASDREREEAWEKKQKKQ